MTIDSVKENLGDFARDIKLNLGSVLTEEGAPDLSQKQIYLIALVSSYAKGDSKLSEALLSDSSSLLDEASVNAAKAAATIMAMNNVYYRFTHLVGDKEFSKMPAKLRMNIIGNPGIDKLDFELMSLAVSAINGCGMCMDAHVHEVTKAGASKQAIQSTIRIASVINAAACALAIH